MQEPQKIHVTGKSAYPGDNSYILTTEPKPNILQRVVGAIGNVFMRLLPDQGNQATTTDTALVTKTSPTIWEYDIFKQEFDRRSILRDIEMIMAQDPRIKRANRVFAATAVRKGMTVTVTSSVNEKLAQQAQDIVNQIMHDCQINGKLASWARILLKDGDLFLNPVIDIATRRIKNIKRLPAISMQRNEGMDGNFTDLEKAFRQIDPISLAIIEEFPLWAVNHIRYDHEEGERYGNSQYLQLRGYWKKLNMTEEDLVVRRRTRAPQRRVHIIGSKDNPADWAQVENYRAKNQMDPRKNQVCTDYYMNSLGDIKTLDGDSHLDEIKDIEHLQEVYMIGTGVPLHIMGFGRNVNRDIVEDQKKQFQEDTQELRDLLEYGDSSSYSGLRFIFDFGLSLQGLDPTLVDYNLGWYADDNETANERVDRAIKLRAAQPKPLISQKLALQLIAKDINLENAESIDAELEEIEAELEVDRQDQTTLKGELNPENPQTKPMSHAAVVKALNDAVKAAKKTKFPLHGPEIGELEKQMVDEIRQQFGAVMEAMQPDLEKIGEKYNHFTDAEHKQKIVDDVLEAFKNAIATERDSRIEGYLAFYRGITNYARENALKQSKVITDDINMESGFVNPELAYYFQEQAGNRIKNVDETTLKALRETLNEAYTSGDKWPDWEARIEKVMDCDVPRGRAEMIARTELAWGYSRGLLSTYQEIGKTRVAWMSVMDRRTCPVCRGRNGETYSLAWAENNFPAHPRCRCTIVAAD